MFVAGFIGSPPMNFVPGHGRGRQLELPFGDGRAATRSGPRPVDGHGTCVIVGIRPEHFEDASLVEDAQEAAGRRRSTRTVDVTEWLGDEQYAYIPYEAPEAITAQLPSCRASSTARSCAPRWSSRSTRPAGSAKAGTRSSGSTPQGPRLRPGVGREPHPGRRGRRGAHPDGEAGPGGTGGGVQGAKRGRRDVGRRRLNRGDEWWRSAVVYEVYLRSFADSDGDGLGDIGGAAREAAVPGRPRGGRRLGHPWYPSPMADGGYDVSDYCDIDPRFGTLADADALLADAHRLGLRVIVDLVANHTSREHPWFAAALAAGPGPRSGTATSSATGGPAARSRRTTGSAPSAAARGRGCGSPTAGRGSGTCTRSPPSSPTSTGRRRPCARSSTPSCGSGWTGGSTGSAWTRRRHGKGPGLPDAGHAPGARFESRTWVDSPHWDVDTVHDILRRWRAIGDSYDGDRLFVTEAVVRDPNGSAVTCGRTRCTPASTSTT